MLWSFVRGIIVINNFFFWVLYLLLATFSRC